MPPGSMRGYSRLENLYVSLYFVYSDLWSLLSNNNNNSNNQIVIMSTIKIAMSFKERFPKCCPFSFKFVKINK